MLAGDLNTHIITVRQEEEVNRQEDDEVNNQNQIEEQEIEEAAK